jgi:hypothetical protein
MYIYTYKNKRNSYFFTIIVLNLRINQMQTNKLLRLRFTEWFDENDIKNFGLGHKTKDK